MFAILTPDRRAITAQRRASDSQQVASDFTKQRAVELWLEVSAGVPGKVLAPECGWSEAHYSKVAHGLQGDLMELLARLPAHRANLRADFFLRLTEAEGVHPIVIAAEEAIKAVSRFLRYATAFGLQPVASEDDERKAG